MEILDADEAHANFAKTFSPSFLQERGGFPGARIGGIESRGEARRLGGRRYEAEGFRAASGFVHQVDPKPQKSGLHLILSCLLFLEEFVPTLWVDWDSLEMKDGWPGVPFGQLAEEWRKRNHAWSVVGHDHLE